MSIVKDRSLAPSGRQKIQWVRDFMPALSGIEERFRREKPFAGLTIAVSVHLEAKTANLGLVLREGGADVHLTGCNPLSTQDDVAAAMADLGVDTYGVHGVDMQGYEDLLVETLKCRPHLIVDDGGDLISLLGGKCAQYGDRLIGGCEETTTGIHRLYARERAGILPCPMMAVNDAKAKHYYDNKYGTGQSSWDAIMHTTNLMVAGKTVVVAGYGWCGKGIAMRAKGMGADVIVTEVDPFKALEATMENFRVMPMDEAARLGDIFVTLTGCKDVITGRHFAVMKDGVLLANSGHFDVEINKDELAAAAVEILPRRPHITGYRMADGRILNLLAEGRLVNLAAGNGHPAEIMDMSFGIQALSLEYMAKHGRELKPAVYPVPREIDRTVALIKLPSMGVTLDRLSDEQLAYMNTVD